MEDVVGNLNWPRAVALAVKDIVDGVLAWRVWLMLAWHEIKQRYRRSTFGALWVTLNMLVQALIMGYLLGFLFAQRMDKFLPYICVSLALWGYMATTIIDCSAAFYGNMQTILQIKRPYTTYILHTVSKNMIIFFHTILVYLFIGPLNGVYPSVSYFWFFPALLVVTIAISWMGLIVAILSTRFRDVPLIVGNLFAVLIWLTPVLYQPSQLGSKQAILQFNPFYSLMEIMRNPLMNQPVPLQSWLIAIAVGIVGWGLAILLLARTRHRIAYWL